MKKNLFLLTWHGGSGGVSKMVYEIARVLKDNEAFDVSVGYAKEGGIYCDQIAKLGVPVKIFNMRNGFDLIGAYKLTKFLHEKKYDIVHLHYLTPLLRLAVYIGNRNLIITEHCGIGEYKLRNLWPLYRLISRFANRVIGKINTTVSECNKRDLLKYGFFCNARDIKVIPNGVDCDIFSRQNVNSGLALPKEIESVNGKKLIGIVKGLTKSHGIDHFILMARELSDRNDLRFIIVGEGEEDRCLKSKAKILGLQDTVYFAGLLPDSHIPKILSLFEVAVLSSEYEGFGILAIEAMAMEVPVVAYAVGGIPEVIDDGKTGILVHKRDPKLLAKAVRDLLDDDSKRKEIALNARKKAEEMFDIREIVNQYVYLYKQVEER